MKSHVAQHGLPRAVICIRHVNARACLCVCVRVWIPLWCSQRVAVHIWRCCVWRCCPHILGISFETKNKDMLGISFEAKNKTQHVQDILGIRFEAKNKTQHVQDMLGISFEAKNKTQF